MNGNPSPIEGELFNLFGKFDYDETLAKIAHSAAVIATSIQAAGGEVPDDVELHDMLAQSMGLPTGEAYRVVRKALLKQGWVLVSPKVDGPVLRLTTLGDQKATEIKKGIEARLATERASRNEAQPPESPDDATGD